MTTVVLLMVFAFIAGAGTAVSPCVLPILPVALAAGSTGGRRRPLGVVTGIVVSFTFATVALVYLISALGLPDDLLRNVAIAILVIFGITLMAPGAAARVEASLSRLTARVPTRSAGDGFGSGFVLGLSLGLLYAPCAGPILAGVITVSASQEFTGERLAVALSYSFGSALVLYGLMLGGRRLTARVARRRAVLQPALGVVMVVVAVAMAAELDIRFQTEIADKLPAALVNPTGDLEAADAAQDRLADLRESDAPKLGRAPEIRGTQRWFNTPGRSALTLAELRGRVVLIDFWTYSCINCIRTLPHLKAWHERYADAGLTIIGIHAPEFTFERDPDNVADAVEQNGLRYPVAQDNDFATWNAYGNQYWPAKYLIDARGQVRYTHFGEGAYDETERLIRELLAEAGRERLGRRTKAAGDTALAGATPETYLGFERAERFVPGPLRPGTRRYRLTRSQARALPPHHAGLDGRWRIDGQSAGPVGRPGRLHLRFYARKVFLVLGSRQDAARHVRVDVDGRLHRRVRVTRHTLYELAALRRAGEHLLTLRVPPGVKGYAFTFG